MHKYLLMIATILFVSMGTAFATGDSPGGAGSYKPYTCEPNDAGVETCYCAGRYDCAVMAASGVCDVPFPEGGSSATSNDTSCDSNFGGVGEYVCECSAEITRPETPRQPGSFNPATENAPRDPSARDHRRPRRSTSSTDDIVSPGNRTSDRDNEVVRARRGTAPVSDDTPEEDEEDVPQTRNVRDHRR